MLVGDETLLGRELRDVLESRKTGAVIAPYSATAEGSFDEEDGEAIYRNPLEAQSLANQEAVLIAGSSEGALKAYELVKAAGGRPTIIDCTRHLDQKPEARIASPLHEAPGQDSSWLLIVPHPASSALALVLTRLASHKPIQRALAHIFEPASELGKRGVSELHRQTNSLFTFKPLDKQVFDAQVSFNLLAQYGEQAAPSLATVEQRIERHLASLLGDQSAASVPIPSLRLIQVPVFHGYSISLWVEFESDVKAAELREALASAQVEVRGQDEEPPNTAGAAGQSGLIAGDVRLDRNDARAAWFWIVGDNFRLTADAAVDLVTGLAAEGR